MDVIVPVYNGEAYLAATLESIDAQTHPPKHLIVVDDGSNDGSVEIVCAVAPHARIIRQTNQGQAAAINSGLGVATAPYVAFLDADDLWEPEKTERQLESLEADPRASYSVTHLQNFVSEEYDQADSAVDPSLLRPMPGFVLSTLMAQRSLFYRVGAFDPELRHANKTEWFLRARESGEVMVQIDDVLVYRRLHAANISQTNASDSLDEYFHMLHQRIARRRQENGP